MPSIADQMLADGCVSHVEAIHGEPIKILDGDDAGRTFIAVKEIESDVVFDAILGEDRRAKRIIRFRDGNVPRIGSQGTVQTEDGRRWTATKNNQDGFLTTDFVLKELVSGLDA
jgi:hypothetical protein